MIVILYLKPSFELLRGCAHIHIHINTGISNNISNLQEIIALHPQCTFRRKDAVLARDKENHGNYSICPESKPKDSFLHACILVLFVQSKELSLTPNPPDGISQCLLWLFWSRNPVSHISWSEAGRADYLTVSNCHYVPSRASKKHFKKEICHVGTGKKRWTSSTSSFRGWFTAKLYGPFGNSDYDNWHSWHGGYNFSSVNSTRHKTS